MSKIPGGFLCCTTRSSPKSIGYYIHFFGEIARGCVVLTLVLLASTLSRIHLFRSLGNRTWVVIQLGKSRFKIDYALRILCAHLRRPCYLMWQLHWNQPISIRRAPNRGNLASSKGYNSLQSETWYLLHTRFKRKLLEQRVRPLPTNPPFRRQKWWLSGSTRSKLQGKP